MKQLEIKYHFKMEDGQKEVFTIRLDPVALENIGKFSNPLPKWTRLSFHQCDNCTLPVASEPSCPAAVSMVHIVERFADLLSHDSALVVVDTEDRTVAHETTVQRGICSLMGLLMATSRCPMTSFFKPMARFHLPFASTEETIWRATSTYLLAQYFKLLDGDKPDIHFDGLTRIYEDIQTVNLAFAKRLRAACNHDSMVNGIILLDMFAKTMPVAIDDSLEEIHHLFAPYLSQVTT
ncbi:MAG: hypothetical protein PVH87_02225 [Desulfobacteraceae bacterium]|jgi:hypothetical protein